MGLSDKLASVRDRALGELDAVEDYFRDAEQLWRLAGVLAVAGTQTGPDLFAAGLFGRQTHAAIVVEQARPELVRLAAKSQDYVAGYLAEATFQQTLAILESFVADLMSDWLTARPDTLGGRQILLSHVLRKGVEVVVAEQAAQVVYDAVYGGPRQWFDALTRHAGLAAPSADDVARLVEAKATRDLLVHNRGRINATYLDKAKALGRGRPGDRINVPEPYRREVWELVRQLVTDLSTAALAKAAPDLPPPAPPG